MPPRIISHQHNPLYRVVKTSWNDPLDVSFSRKREDRRWNTPDFGALYCCCSEGVARAVALDCHRSANVTFEDLQESSRPQLVEIQWQGEQVVDVISAGGLAAAGFPANYPDGVSKVYTRQCAEGWFRNGREAVVSRSASLWRRSFRDWKGSHEKWSEVAIFVDNAKDEPHLMRRREDLDWFLKFPKL